MHKNINDWAWDILIAFDRLINAILGGSPEETVSARMGLLLHHTEEDNVKCKYCMYISHKVCYFLDFIDKDHCKKSAQRALKKEIHHESE